MFAWTKRLLAFTLFAALAVMPPCVLRAQWVQTNAPRAGNCSGVCIDSTGVIYIATRDDGIFRSIDTGRTWLVADTGLYNLNIDNEAWILGCAPNGIAYIRVNEEVYHTLDHGASWVSDTDLTHFDNRFLNSMQLSDGTLLAGTCPLSRSTDMGRTWTLSDSGFTAPHCALAIRKGIQGKLYLISGGTPAMLFVSSDYGLSWQLTHTIQEDFSSFEIVKDDSIAQTLFLGRYDDNGGFSGVIRSVDGGITWDTVLSGFGILSLIQDKHKRLLTASPYSSEIQASTDLGVTWNGFDTKYPDIWGLVVTNTNMVVAASYGGGMYLLHDGDTSCEFSYIGLPYTQVSGIIQVGKSNFVSYANNVGVWRSEDNGFSWNRVGYRNLPCNASCAAFDGSGRLLLGTRAGLAYSLDSGLTWDMGIISNPINAMVKTDSGSVAMATDSGYLILDAGNSLVHRPQNLQEGFSWISLALAANGDVVAIGTRTFYYQANQQWISYSGLFNMSNPASQIVFAHPHSVTKVDSILYVYTDDGSGGNGGLTAINPDFTTRLVKLPKASNNPAICMDSSGMLLLAISGSGVFRTSDGGVSWSAFSDGLTNLYIGALLCATDKSLFAVSGESTSLIKGGGIFKTSANSSVTINNRQQKSSDFLLSHPNPFSQSTQISFTSVSAGYADISIVNLLGEQVARIFSGELDAGQHSFTFSNTANLPDGMYECLVRMNGQVEKVEKVGMVLLH